MAWVQTALLHLKVMGHTADAQPLLDAAGVIIDEGVIVLAAAGDVTAFTDTAATGRVGAQTERANRPLIQDDLFRCAA